MPFHPHDDVDTIMQVTQRAGCAKRSRHTHLYVTKLLDQKVRCAVRQNVAKESPELVSASAQQPLKGEASSRLVQTEESHAPAEQRKI